MLLHVQASTVCWPWAFHPKMLASFCWHSRAYRPTTNANIKIRLWRTNSGSGCTSVSFSCRLSISFFKAFASSYLFRRSAAGISKWRVRPFIVYQLRQLTLDPHNRIKLLCNVRDHLTFNNRYLSLISETSWGTGDSGFPASLFCLVSSSFGRLAIPILYSDVLKDWAQKCNAIRNMHVKWEINSHMKSRPELAFTSTAGRKGLPKLYTRHRRYQRWRRPNNGH